MTSEGNNVKVSTCKTRSRSRLEHTPHGTVKVIESVPVESKGKDKR